MKNLKLLLLNIAIILISSNAYSAVRCENLFLTQKQFAALFNPEKLSVKQSQKMIDATIPEKESGSTTGDRTEYKFTLSKEVLSKKLKAFKNAIEAEVAGFILNNRDPVVKGFRNVTLTKYSKRFKLTLESGQKIVAKIRLRKYGLISNSEEVSVGNFNPIESMKDVSYLEFKIENPDYENSVLKPRIKIYDADAELLQNPNLKSDTYYEIAHRCMELNKTEDPAQQEITNKTVSLMLNAIHGLHKKGSQFKMEYVTLYERTSYKAPIQSQVNGETYEIQITIDENISASSLSFKYEASNYKNQPEEISVTEMKLSIPLIEKLIGDRIANVPGKKRAVSLENLIALLTPEDYQNFPGLKPVIEFLQTLQFNTLRSFEENHGKLFHLRKEIKQELKP